MELPYTIVFEPPSRSELRALLRMRGQWIAGVIVALAIGSVYILANVARADARTTAAVAPLAIRSDPPGAAIEVDGRRRGATPADLEVDSGRHRVVLRSADALDGQYSVDVGADGAQLHAVLWRRQAELTRLRPALPGAAIADARLLADGDVGVSIELPPGGQLQAWRLEPRSGALEPVLTNVAGLRLTFAADGHHLAYLGSEIGPPSSAGPYAAGSSAASVVWLMTPQDQLTPALGWRAPLEPGEQLADVSWSPSADRLLVVSSQGLAGGAIASRVWLLEVDGQHARAVVSLPSQIVPGSAVWSPDGSAIAFVAHAGEVNALCLLRTDGTFRYVADLDPSSTSPLPQPPLAWSTDGQRLLIVAPHQHPPGVGFNWLQPDLQHAVYLASLDEPAPRALGDTDMDLATWREDGQVLGLGRAGGDGPLGIRLLNLSSGSDQQVLELPLKPATRYAAQWDVAGARLLIASRASSGATEYWLARLGLEGDR